VSKVIKNRRIFFLHIISFFTGIFISVVVCSAILFDMRKKISALAESSESVLFDFRNLSCQINDNILLKKHYLNLIESNLNQIYDEKLTEKKRIYSESSFIHIKINNKDLLAENFDAYINSISNFSLFKVSDSLSLNINVYNFPVNFSKDTIQLAHECNFCNNPYGSVRVVYENIEYQSSTLNNHDTKISLLYTENGIEFFFDFLNNGDFINGRVFISKESIIYR
jgi:hypothetical protein